MTHECFIYFSTRACVLLIGTNALYALSSDGLRVEAKMYDGMICKCTPRPPPGPELTLPGVGPWYACLHYDDIISINNSRS